MRERGIMLNNGGEIDDEKYIGFVREFYHPMTASYYVDRLKERGAQEYFDSCSVINVVPCFSELDRIDGRAHGERFGCLVLEGRRFDGYEYAVYLKYMVVEGSWRIANVTMSVSLDKGYPPPLKGCPSEIAG